MIHIILFFILLLSPTLTNAQTPKLAFPLDCTLNKDCFTATYMDMDAKDNTYQDFTCGRKTYDAHKGTDFAIRSRIEMDKGVNVLAAANGTILRTRDGADDNPKTMDEYTAIRKANKDCGNGIIIQHKDNLQTFYCHLKQGSIQVKQGDTVKTGQPIAQIGQSGFSEFPHLHFTVIKDNKHTDPFTGTSANQGCGVLKNSLWETPLFYEPFTLYDGGFITASTPDFTTIKAGTYIHPTTLKANAEALIYWIALYHRVAGDEIRMTIRDPQNQIIGTRNITIETNKKRPTIFYTGRKLSKPLSNGIYTATTTFTRTKNGIRSAQKTYTHSIKVE